MVNEVVKARDKLGYTARGVAMFHGEYAMGALTPNDEKVCEILAAVEENTPNKSQQEERR